MKSTIKKAIKASIKTAVDISRKTRFGRYLHSQILNMAMEQVVNVCHNGLNMKFSAPNSLSYWRAETFSTKEPETLEWIDSIRKDSVFWDIGANIGLYSIYAAKRNNCQVWAFDPSVFNLELLARNIYLNDLTDRICILPFALSDSLGANKLRLTTTEWGGALSTFGKDFGWDGKTICSIFEFRTFGLSMDDVVKRLSIPTPDYIKMDVDGLEHFILKGGSSVLRNIKEIIIEVNDDFHDQAEECRVLLNQAGLILKDKKHSEIIENSKSGFRNCYDQIWIRP